MYLAGKRLKRGNIATAAIVGDSIPRKKRRLANVSPMYGQCHIMQPTSGQRLTSLYILLANI